MRSVALFCMIVLSLQAASLEDLVRHYKKGNYGYVCRMGYKMFDRIKHSEAMVSMYAYACLKDDKLDRLAVPILILGKTPAGRKNRAYFSLILAQKNLLIASLCDGIRMEGLQVPDTDHLISKIFNLYYQKKLKKVDNRYSYTSPDNQVRYTIEVQRKGRCSIIVKEYDHGTTHEHRYR